MVKKFPSDLDLRDGATSGLCVTSGAAGEFHQERHASVQLCCKPLQRLREVSAHLFRVDVDEAVVQPEADKVAAVH